MSVPRVFCVGSALLSAVEGVEHGFFGRPGEVCGGFGMSAGMPAGAVFVCRQAHGCRVRRVEAGADARAVFAGDAQVTRAAGVALGVLSADCAPLLFADPVARVVGAAHAGWRGALAGVTDAVVAEMARLGARPGRMVCAVGPAIQVDSYPVGADWARRVRAASPVACGDCFRCGGGDSGDADSSGNGDRHSHSDSGDGRGNDGDGGRDGSGGRSDDGDGSGNPNPIHFDLPNYLRRRLARAGVGAVEKLAHDTFADARFFSHRRSQARGGTCGRQLSVIMLR
ncbi:MAG: polyphenol oxidase family protein [Gammaproteobacteria bacterium]|nr:polyphenol oxidase family protein [Gammaproteobacteria bacterium]